VDNPVSYPQAARSGLAGSPAAPHAGGMRQALAAGDDTPRTPRIPQAPPDPQDAHDLQSPRDPQGRDDRRPDLVVRAGSPAALLTLVPHLLGFVPEASLVVIGVAPPGTVSGSRSATTCPNRPSPT
jgi:hypothetical protein